MLQPVKLSEKSRGFFFVAEMPRKCITLVKNLRYFGTYLNFFVLQKIFEYLRGNKELGKVEGLSFFLSSMQPAVSSGGNPNPNTISALPDVKLSLEYLVNDCSMKYLSNFKKSLSGNAEDSLNQIEGLW